LGPIIAYDTTKMKLTDTKNSKFTGLDIYSKIDIITLANTVPEFKAWLVSNGWKDTDF